MVFSEELDTAVVRPYEVDCEQFVIHPSHSLERTDFFRHFAASAFC